MALDQSVADREYKKFSEVSGTTALNVNVLGGGSSTDGGTFSAGTTSGNISQGVYEATPTTVADGKVGAIGIDSSRNVKTTQATQLAGENLTQDVLGINAKPVVSASYSGIAFSNFGAATNALVKSTAAQLKSFHVQNENAAIRYFQIFNLTTAPVEDTSVPIFSFEIPAGSSTVPGVCEKGTEFFGEGGYFLSAGFSWGISVDPDVWDSTGVTAGEHQVNGISI